jgi:hypothetical protein
MSKIPPDYSKGIDKSARYWEYSAYIENQNRGAPEDPYAPTYAKASRSTTRALSSAPQTTNTLEFLKALGNVRNLNLQWETTPTTRGGIISLGDLSVPIQYSHDSSSGTDYLKWGDKEFHIRNKGANHKYPEISKYMYVLLKCLETAFKYSIHSKEQMTFSKLYCDFVSRAGGHGPFKVQR